MTYMQGQDGTTGAHIAVLAPEALTNKDGDAVLLPYSSLPGDSGSPVFGVSAKGAGKLLAPQYYHWGRDNSSGYKILLAAKKRSAKPEKRKTSKSAKKD